MCGAAQFLRPAYDWLGTPLSFYLIGPYGGAVHAAFFALVPGLIAVGAGGYHALARRARSAAPLLLFVVSAIALAVTALAPTDMHRWPSSLHGTIHIIAAATTFVCVTVAMLLQAWRLRLDHRWRARFRAAFSLAAAAFIALWLYALVRAVPRGLGEKIVVALILVWLWRMGWWLLRADTACGAHDPDARIDRHGP